MRAVRLVAANRLEVVDIPDPAPAPGEVLVRIVAAGICGSDLSCYKTGVFAGSVLGHEFAGVVAEDANGWRAGTPVVVDPKLPCGECADCLGGTSYRCVSALTSGPGGLRDGGFAEQIAVPAFTLHPLPQELSPENACLVEPLSVAIHGVERGGQTPHEAVVVGLGPIGLLTVAALRARGCERVTGVDPVEVRRALASKIGATNVVDRIEDAPSDVPFVAECSGRPDALQPTTNLLASGGIAVLLGVPVGEATVTPIVWVTREHSVIGAISSSPDDFRAAIALLAATPEIAGIITKRVALEELPAAFAELIAKPADGKVAADPRKETS